jgi:sigma-B regulation protein RsbU (phosphoserine phosphatase)
VTRTVVRLVAPHRGVKADETLKDTNRLLAKQLKRGMFVTACYAVLDEATGLLTYASAGHNPMVIYRAKTRTAELATAKGIALGFNEGPVFDRTIQVAQLQLERGDAIVLYTDGFPEAMNSVSEEFGDENFYRLIARNGHLSPQGLIDAAVAGVAAHRGDAEQSDDLTILTVRRS